MSNLSRFLETMGPAPNSNVLEPDHRRQLSGSLQRLGMESAEHSQYAEIKRQSAELVRLSGRLESLSAPTTTDVLEVADAVNDFTRRAQDVGELKVLGSAIYRVVESIVEIASDKRDGVLLDRVQRAISAL